MVGGWGCEKNPLTIQGHIVQIIIRRQESPEMLLTFSSSQTSPSAPKHMPSFFWDDLDLCILFGQIQ